MSLICGLLMLHCISVMGMDMNFDEPS